MSQVSHSIPAEGKRKRRAKRFVSTNMETARHDSRQTFDKRS